VKLYKHQENAIVRCTKQNLLLHHDCGCGKTLSLIHVIKHWKSHYGPKFRALVVCPLSIIKDAWASDVKKFAPDLDIVSLWSKDCKALLKEQHDIYLINFERLRVMFPEIAKRGFQVAIVDESSKMKSPKTQITKALLALSGTRSKGWVVPDGFEIPHRYCASGTPAPNDESEWWAQITFLDPEIFGTSFFQFRNRYFTSIDIGGGMKIFKFRSRNRQEFSEKMRPVVDVVRKADALDLPPMVDVEMKYDMPAKLMDQYKTLEQELVLELEGVDVLAQHHLTKIQKLRQIACGFVYHYGAVNAVLDNMSSRILDDANTRLKLLEEILETIGNRQVVIWTNFTAAADMIAKTETCKECNSERTHINKEVAVARFLSGDAQYLIANPASVGHGMNFQHNATEAIWFNPDWSYELQEQAKNRLHRIGQDEKVTNYHIIARGTIDEIVSRNVANKHEMTKSIITYLRGQK
jgi:SNF2 family DNA or RNA helicase